MKKPYLRDVWNEAVSDKARLTTSLAVDGYGAASTLGYLFGVAPGVLGDMADSATALGQTGWILAAYWKDLTPKQKIALGALSLGEEILPGVTDIVPSATIAHFTAAYERVKKRGEK